MTVAWPIPIAASLALAALALYRSHIAGWLGELRIGMALAGLPRDSYTLLHDVRIPDGRGGHVHIDHLVRGPSGYDVVSTVELSGRLSGRVDDESWTLTPSFGQARRIPNPLSQNRRRAEALGRLVAPVPVRMLTLATRIRFPDGRPDGVLAANQLAERILALDTEAPPFDDRAGHRALGLAMEDGAAGRHRHYGGRWRNPAGHALLATAACILAFTAPRPPAAPPAPVVRYKPVPLASPAPAHASIPDAGPPSAMVVTTRKRRHRRHTTSHHRRPKDPMQVVAMSNSLVSIMENGHLITLRPGQKSPHGWRLVRATPRYADMIDPHGRHFHFTP